MPRHPRSWVALTLVSALALAVGYLLPRPPKGGDMLDAVGAVQRHSPRFLISDPIPSAHWVRTGALYLCRTPRTVEEVEDLSKYPWRRDPRWAGVICFKGTIDPPALYVPAVSEKGDNYLDYGTFAVFGDPEMLQEVQAILAAEGFQRAE